MIDGIDYFPKRDKQKKGADREWDDLKKIKQSQKPGKTIVPETKSKPDGKDSDASK